MFSTAGAKTLKLARSAVGSDGRKAGREDRPPRKSRSESAWAAAVRNKNISATDPDLRVGAARPAGIGTTAAPVVATGLQDPPGPVHVVGGEGLQVGRHCEAPVVHRASGQNPHHLVLVDLLR